MRVNSFCTSNMQPELSDSSRFCKGTTQFSYFKVLGNHLTEGSFSYLQFTTVKNNKKKDKVETIEKGRNSDKIEILK